jgi:hypothetical protein
MAQATYYLMQYALEYLKFNLLNNSNIHKGYYYSCTDLTRTLVTSRIARARKSEAYFRKEVK